MIKRVFGDNSGISIETYIVPVSIDSAVTKILMHLQGDKAQLFVKAITYHSNETRLKQNMNKKAAQTCCFI